MFKIPVSDLLSSYSWDSKAFSFSWEIYDGSFEDLSFLTPLEFSIQILALENGVDVVFDTLHTRVAYEWKPYDISIWHFERSFRLIINPLEDPDDVRSIEWDIIDLAPVIREEIIMATHM